MINDATLAPARKVQRSTAPRRSGAPRQPAAVEFSAAARLETLRAAFHKADEKLEAAYDAAKRGSAVETLLEHINHDLSISVMSPILRNEDEAEVPVTKADAKASYNAAFKMLAALEGAMALSRDDAIHPVLMEAFNLLGWAQSECNSCKLGRLLPDFDEEAAFARGRDLAIELLEQGQQLHETDKASGMRMFRPLDETGSAPAQDAFVLPFLEQVAYDRSLLAGFAAVLSAALSEDSVYDPAAYRAPMAEFLAGAPGQDGTEVYQEADDARAAELAERATAPQANAEWWRLDQIDGELNNAEILNDMIVDACQFSYSDEDECELAQGRIILLSRAVDGYLVAARTELQERVRVAQEATQ